MPPDDPDAAMEASGLRLRQAGLKGHFFNRLLKDGICVSCLVSLIMYLDALLKMLSLCMHKWVRCEQ